MASMRALGTAWSGMRMPTSFFDLRKRRGTLTPALRMKVKGPGRARFISVKTGGGRGATYWLTWLRSWQRREKLASLGLKSRSRAIFSSPLVEPKAQANEYTESEGMIRTPSRRNNSPACSTLRSSGVSW